ncbi:uncharacterized protein [Aristolochia californica]|uniref:uncharacterized protein n=1 Tax=Aristolochia californica TaxID=171875 RepID=UPI0035D9D82D
MTGSYLFSASVDSIPPSRGPELSMPYILLTNRRLDDFHRNRSALHSMWALSTWAVIVAEHMHTKRARSLKPWYERGGASLRQTKMEWNGATETLIPKRNRAPTAVLCTHLWLVPKNLSSEENSEHDLKTVLGILPLLGDGNSLKNKDEVLCASNEDHTVVEPLLPPEGTKHGEGVSFSGFEGEAEDVLKPEKKQLEKITLLMMKPS